MDLQSSNNIGDAGARALSDSLKFNTTLRVLDMVSFLSFVLVVG